MKWAPVCLLIATIPLQAQVIYGAKVLPSKPRLFCVHGENLRAANSRALPPALMVSRRVAEPQRTIQAGYTENAAVVVPIVSP
jgi:hypothetical protein